MKGKSKELNSAVEKLSQKIKLEYPNIPNSNWVALRLLEGDQSIIDAVRTGELGNIKEVKRAITEDELQSEEAV
ncbi:MAG: hypothetical protein P8Y81_08770 [Ignavibacteriaceae bacterium]